MQHKATFRDLAAAIIHQTLQEGISERGSKECAYFAGNIEAMWISFQTYVSELNKVKLTDAAILSNLPEGLTDGQRKAILTECKKIVREVNMRHQQTLQLLGKWVREFDRLSEVQKEMSYEAVDN